MDSHGFIGPFHMAALLKELEEAATSHRHLLITGPSGSGKELAVRAVAKMLGKEVRVHNAARFTSEEEAMSTLFGIGTRCSRTWTLGLDLSSKRGTSCSSSMRSITCLSGVQRSLLRIVEDAEYERIGGSSPSKIDLRFVFASNAPGLFNGVAKDLYARLLKISIPSLRERVADIPALFRHLVLLAGEQYGVDVSLLVESLSRITTRRFAWVTIILCNWSSKRFSSAGKICSRCLYDRNWE